MTIGLRRSMRYYQNSSAVGRGFFLREMKEPCYRTRNSSGRWYKTLINRLNRRVWIGWEGA